MNQVIPLVSVCVTTFNHKDYIAECLDNILMQKTTFPIEIILGEDDSSDGTREICIDYAERFPDKIKLFLRSRKDVIYINGNPTGRFNFMENLKSCQGKYIALCEGDDYWTDPLKLQKQVDFLEADTGYNYCGHNSYSLTKGVLKELQLALKSFEFKELIFKNYLSTATLVFRKTAINKLPPFFKDVPAGDWALQLLAIKNSKGYVLDDNMSVYRIHDHGIWSNLDSEKMCLQGVVTMEAFKKVYPDRTSKRLINKAILHRKRKFGIYKPSLFERGLNKLKKYF